MELKLTYQNFALLEHYLKINQISIINKKYEENVCCTIELTEEEKQKLENEITEKKISVEKMQILKEKNIEK